MSVEKSVIRRDSRKRGKAMNHTVIIIFLASLLFPSVRVYDRNDKQRFMADGILICLINLYFYRRKAD